MSGCPAPGDTEFDCLAEGLAAGVCVKLHLCFCDGRVTCRDRLAAWPAAIQRHPSSPSCPGLCL